MDDRDDLHEGDEGEFIDFHARLLALAREQRRVAERNAIAQQMRDEYYEQYIKPLDDEIAANSAGLAEMEAALKAEVLSHAMETGELKLHPAITFRRTTKLVYDKMSVLESLKREGVAEYIRVKEELDVRGFEKAWRAGSLAWLEEAVEQVVEPTVSLGKLGDLLIAAEGDGDL
jgi:phage host-nuclease inhibitor protein Gam